MLQLPVREYDLFDLDFFQNLFSPKKVIIVAVHHDFTCYFTLFPNN
jgi:hypothetical protein